jgi:hypothetical protein
MKCLVSLGIALLCGGLVGCAPIKKYDVQLESTENLTLKKTTPNRKEVEGLKFEDSLIAITFSPTTTSIEFEMVNKTDSTIKVPWDEVVYVDEYGNSERVMHAGVKYISRDQSMPPSIVVKGGKLDDLISPSSNVYYSGGKYGSGWTNSKLFNDASVGKTVAILLPLLVGEKRHEYLFKFSVNPPKLPVKK